MMNRKMTKAIILSILTTVAVFLSSATVGSHSEFLLLVGPASIATDQPLEIMDQVVILESSDAKGTVAKIESGSYIAVFGYISETGQLTSTRIEVLDSQYVPGSSPVLVSGLHLGSLDKNGHVSLRELTIDVTPSLSTYTQIESHEEIAVFAGLQPNPDGIMLAYSAIGFESYSDFSEFQVAISDAFLANIDGGFSIDGGGFSIGGGGEFSIGGGGEFSIDGYDDSTM